MAVPKTYIYSFDGYRVLVCSYSVELFNALVKHAKADSLVFVGEPEVVSHKTHSRSSCSCSELVKAAADRVRAKLKTFERVIAPVELLELVTSSSSLFVCELQATRRGTATTRLKVLHTSEPSGPRETRYQRVETGKPRHCLFKLCRILNDGVWLKSVAAVGRNNSFTGKSAVYKKCCKEIARELAETGALPADFSQKCVYSADTNRCWFDYCRIMDICIHHKLSAREIADFIKHLAAVDPMQPDPVVCIKRKFEPGPTRSSTVRACRNGSSERDSSADSSSPLSASRSDSSSSPPVEPVRSGGSSRRQCPSAKTEIHLRCKRSPRKPKTYSSTQTEPEPGYRRCQCRKLGQRPCETDRNRFLWTPDGLQTSAWRPSRASNVDSPDDNEHFYDEQEADEFDPRLYEDFLRQTDYTDNEDVFIPDCLEEFDDPLYGYGEADGPYYCDPTRPKPVFAVEPQRQGALSDRQWPGKNAWFLHQCHEDPGGTRTRSSSQPVLPAGRRTYKLVSNTNNSRGAACHSDRERTDHTIDCSTQTARPSRACSDQSLAKMKRFASDSNLCLKGFDHQTENNSNQGTRTALDNVTNLPDPGVKTFKGEAVQTDSPPSELSRCPTASLRSCYQQTTGDDSNAEVVSKCFNRRRAVPNCGSACCVRHANRGHLKMCCHPVCQDQRRTSPPELQYRHPLNRNANNHSLSRSASSRNSQVVEVEHEGGHEKVSSVLVESEARPVILYREASFDRRKPITSSPFFETGLLGTAPGPDNSNASNAIKSVTVSNQGQSGRSGGGAVGVAVYKCSEPACRNLTEGLNYFCRLHMPPPPPLSPVSPLSGPRAPHSTVSPPPPPCSPDRCLSRLSCIVELNKHLLGRQWDLGPEPSVQIGALHRAIFGPYSDEECARALGLASQPPLRESDSVPVQSEVLSNDSQFLLSLSDPNRRFCSNYASSAAANPSAFSKQLLVPLHAAMNSLRDDLQECQALLSRRFDLADAEGLHSAASLPLQSEPLGETANPLEGHAWAQCQHAANGSGPCSCVFQPDAVSTNKPPLNGTYRVSYVQEAPQAGTDSTRSPERLLPGYETVAGTHQARSSSAAVADASGRYQLPETRVTFDPHPQRIGSGTWDASRMVPCGRRIPVNVQLCPVPGCTNLTTTRSPPCLDRPLQGHGASGGGPPPPPGNSPRPPPSDSDYWKLHPMIFKTHTGQSSPGRDEGSPSYGHGGQVCHDNVGRDPRQTTQTGGGHPAQCEILVEGDASQIQNGSQARYLGNKRALADNSVLKSVTTDSTAFRQRETAGRELVPRGASKQRDHDRQWSGTPQHLQDLSQRYSLRSSRADPGQPLGPGEERPSEWTLYYNEYQPNKYRVSQSVDRQIPESIRELREALTELRASTAGRDVGSNVNHRSELRTVSTTLDNEQAESVASLHYDLAADRSHYRYDLAMFHDVLGTERRSRRTTFQTDLRGHELPHAIRVTEQTPPLATAVLDERRARSVSPAQSMVQLPHARLEEVSPPSTVTIAFIERLRDEPDGVSPRVVSASVTSRRQKSMTGQSVDRVPPVDVELMSDPKIQNVRPSGPESSDAGGALEMSTVVAGREKTMIAQLIEVGGSVTTTAAADPDYSPTVKMTLASDTRDLEGDNTEPSIRVTTTDPVLDGGSLISITEGSRTAQSVQPWTRDSPSLVAIPNTEVLETKPESNYQPSVPGISERSTLSGPEMFMTTQSVDPGTRLDQSAVVGLTSEAEMLHEQPAGSSFLNTETSTGGQPTVRERERSMVSQTVDPGNVADHQPPSTKSIPSTNALELDPLSNSTTEDVIGSSVVSARPSSLIAQLVASSRATEPTSSIRVIADTRLYSLETTRMTRVEARPDGTQTERLTSININLSKGSLTEARHSVKPGPRASVRAVTVSATADRLSDQLKNSDYYPGVLIEYTITTDNSGLESFKSESVAASPQQVRKKLSKVREASEENTFATTSMGEPHADYDDETESSATHTSMAQNSRYEITELVEQSPLNQSVVVTDNELFSPIRRPMSLASHTRSPKVDEATQSGSEPDGMTGSTLASPLRDVGTGSVPTRNAKVNTNETQKDSHLRRATETVRSPHPQSERCDLISNRYLYDSITFRDSYQPHTLMNDLKARQQDSSLIDPKVFQDSDGSKKTRGSSGRRGYGWEDGREISRKYDLMDESESSREYELKDGSKSSQTYELMEHPRESSRRSKQRKSWRKSNRGDQRSRHKDVDGAKCKHVSVFNQKFPIWEAPNTDDINVCTEMSSRLYSYVLDIDIGRTYPGEAAPYLIYKLGQAINNSSNLKFVPQPSQDWLESVSHLDQRLDPHSDQYSRHNVSFSSVGLVAKNHPNRVVTSENFSLDSDLALEYSLAESDSLAALVDQFADSLYFLVTSYVMVQRCNRTTPLLTVNQNLSKTKKSKIKRLLKSIRSAKSQRQTTCGVKDDRKPDKRNKMPYKMSLFPAEFKTRMLTFIRKCRSHRLNPAESSLMEPHWQSSTTKEIELSIQPTDTREYERHHDELFRDGLDMSRCNLWTRSCCDIPERNGSRVGEFRLARTRKRSSSQPTKENGYKTTFGPANSRGASTVSPADFPTSGLSLLCFEVLEKMERRIGKNPRLVEQLVADKFLDSMELWPESSKDTVKLIGRALQYLYGGPGNNDSRQSNKTLDSVSSIRTCSADCIESISSLRQEILRPIVTKDTVISAYNRYFIR